MELDGPNLHDATLTRIELAWKPRRLAIDVIVFRGAWFRIGATGLRAFSCTREDSWGPSSSINAARGPTRRDTGILHLELEMQSGDVISVDAESFDMTALLVDSELTEPALTAMSERCDAATPGPWTSFVEGRDQQSGSSFIQTHGGGDIELSGASVADQDFIAAARQDLPRLIADARALRGLDRR